MPGVATFRRKVERIARQADADTLGVSEEDIRILMHSRQAPPCAGIYCQFCSEPLRPDTLRCPECGSANPVKPLI